MKKITRLVVVSTVFIFSGMATAAPYFTITKSTSVSFPSQMLLGTQGLGDYIVTNVSGKAQTVNVQNLPAGFSVVSATGLSPASCGSSSLANGASCTVRLSYVSNTPTTVSQLLPTVCPTSQYVTGCITPSTATTFSVSNSPAEMATLSIPFEALLFVPGKTTQVSVTNTSTSVTANNVQLNLPPELVTYLNSGAVIRCSQVPPGQSCTFTLPMKSELDANTRVTSTSIRASNAQSLNFQAQVNTSGGLLDVSSVTFATPSTETMTLTNEGLSSVTNLSKVVTFPSGVSDGGGSCDTTIAPGVSCTYVYQASQNAYGSAAVTLSYTQGGVSQTDTSGTVSVANTTVEINGGQDIVGSTSPASGSFSIRNTGNFAWQSPAVTRSTTDGWLTLNVSNCTGTALAPGASCNISYTITPPHDFSSVITASGNNIQDTTENFNPDEYISIGVEGDVQYQHLGYKAIKVTNLTNVTESLSVTSASPPSALASQVTLCNETGSNCGTAGASFAKSNCFSGQLAAGATCRLWYQANASTTLVPAPNTPPSSTISLTATPSGGTANPLSRSISFAYDNALYAGGAFTTAGGNAANRIAKWNGTSWSALGTGTNGFLGALAVFNGDLYVGGAFTQAGGNSANNIAQWNGSSWSPLIAGLNNVGLNASVSALTTFNGALYAGGEFTDAGGNENADRIAQWDGNNWYALGAGINNNVVNDLSTSNDTLYVSGFFTLTIGANTVNNIAKWNGSSWSALGTGTTGFVNTLTFLDPYLYVGGSFSTISGNTANNIARLNTLNGTWSALSNGSGQGTGSGVVTSLSPIGTKVIVAGGFTNIARYFAQYDTTTNLLSQTLAGNQPTNGGTLDLVFSLGNVIYLSGNFTKVGPTRTTDAINIAQWNTSTNVWSGLGTGTNSIVFALTSAPSLSLS